MKMQSRAPSLLLIPCLTVLVTAQAAAPAAAFPHAPSVTTVSAADQIKFRRGYGNRSGRYVGRGGGGGNGVGIGLGIIGAVIAGSAIADAVGGNHWRSASDHCAATFRSFDRSSGTYTSHDGETRTCPYL